MTSTSDDDELSSVPNQLDARGWMIDACLNAYGRRSYPGMTCGQAIVPG